MHVELVIDESSTYNNQYACTVSHEIQRNLSKIPLISLDILGHNFGSIALIFKIQLLAHSGQCPLSFKRKNKTLAKAKIGRNRKDLAPQK